MRTADERLLAQVIHRLDRILRRLDAIEARTRLIGADREAMFRRLAGPKRTRKRAAASRVAG